MEPSYPAGYIGSLYLLEGSGWPLSPPLLQTCLLQSSSLLPHVYRRRTVALLRHDAVFFLFFPPAALRMVSCGCFPLPLPFLFRFRSRAAVCVGPSLLKLSLIYLGCTLYTFNFLLELRATRAKG